MKTPVLKKQVIKIFQKFGLSKDHALISTNALINAELVGAYGHGLSRLKMYCDRISKKVINPKPKIKIKKISSSISFLQIVLFSVNKPTLISRDRCKVTSMLREV